MGLVRGGGTRARPAAAVAAVLPRAAAPAHLGSVFAPRGTPLLFPLSCRRRCFRAGPAGALCGRRGARSFAPSPRAGHAPPSLTLGRCILYTRAGRRPPPRPPVSTHAVRVRLRFWPAAAALLCACACDVRAAPAAAARAAAVSRLALPPRFPPPFAFLFCSRGPRALLFCPLATLPFAQCPHSSSFLWPAAPASRARLPPCRGLLPRLCFAVALVCAPGRAGFPFPRGAAAAWGAFWLLLARLAPPARARAGSGRPRRWAFRLSLFPLLPSS